MAKCLAASKIVPETFRNNIPDCMIALEMASRIGANPMAVMQNLYIVHGKPAWSSQFLISCINASGKFSPLRYKETGEKGKDSQGIIAWAKDKSGEVLDSPEVNIKMAKAEGWFSKNGSKWQTMPDLMLRYRAATLFARTYCPELTMGMHTDDEVIDISPIVTETVVKKSKIESGDLLSSIKKEVIPIAPAAPPDESQESKNISAANIKHIVSLGKSIGKDETYINGWLSTIHGIDGIINIPQDKFEDICAGIKAGCPEKQLI